jgi:hypothetical protein
VRSIQSHSSFIEFDYLFPQDSREEPHVRRDRDLPDIASAQEGKLHQAGLLPCLFLLLPLPVCLIGSPDVNFGLMANIQNDRRPYRRG